jgi:hypothetical protein
MMVARYQMAISGVLLGSCVRAEVADGRLHTLPLVDTPMHLRLLP